MPELVCFRYNPGERRTGNSIIGNPIEAKYGVSHDQILDAYRQVKERGARRFGLHTMLASNERNYTYMVETARMLLELVEWISGELDIRFDFINIGGGLGIPYMPGDAPLDIESMAREITVLFDDFKGRNGYAPRMYVESGRYMTGPHGVLVTRAINRKEIYRTYVGVDACMSALMRPGMYGAYHHVSVLGKSGEDEVVDVAGSLCAGSASGWNVAKRWSMSPAPCARTMTSSPCRDPFPGSRMGISSTSTTPAPTDTPWDSTTTARRVRRSCC